MQIVVMEFAGEQSLQRLLDDAKEALSEQQRISFLVQIASALNHLHDKCIAHLDLKPTNIMISSGHVCKLVDFGCSRRIQVNSESNRSQTPSPETASHSLCVGTVAYAAPELFKGSQPSLACDIYSLGIIMWQLVTREIAFVKSPVDSIIYRVIAQKLRPTFPETFHTSSSSAYVQLASRCWHEDAQVRPTSSECLLLSKYFSTFSI
jgi:proto-oncogene serine/threonine-protein kinase mos